MTDPAPLPPLIPTSLPSPLVRPDPWPADGPGAGDPVTVVRRRLAALVGLPVEAVHLDLDADLLDPGGYAVGDQILDSLSLVELVTTLEEDHGRSLQELLDRGAPLTLRTVLDELAPAP